MSSLIGFIFFGGGDGEVAFNLCCGIFLKFYILRILWTTIGELLLRTGWILLGGGDGDEAFNLWLGIFLRCYILNSL